ncbi:branched-chain amino acid dehydrogenase [Marinitoga sp. 1135]|uniref:CoA transferase subunit A n=1 Tax=Marinitoga sp. 1135 TaxID=1643333 RepID=UPI001585E3F6|nr:3-oxoacid CoA-transferase subunit A [Marinitoga sp. 1135]NUU95150.1 branched-chain amino acid dehydrogenase [Marinitoga sp. 1135]
MKVVKAEEAVKVINDGDSIMIGGFLTIGTPETLIDEIIKQKKKDLTIICNDTSFETKGIGRLIYNKLAKKVVTSHIGTNKETQRQMIEKELEVELVPQGTLIEQIRAGGVGLGGILTPTGIGTIVEEGKQIIEIDGKKYILEKAIRAKVALVKAKKADHLGNLTFSFTASNFNPIIAMAADTVIVEVDELVPVGTITPEEVQFPGALVDYVVIRGRE